MSLNKQDLEGARKFKTYLLDAITDFVRLYECKYFMGFFYTVRSFIEDCFKDFAEIASKDKDDVDLT